MAVRPGQQQPAPARASLLSAVAAARSRTQLSVAAVLDVLGLDAATYYRWRQAERAAQKERSARATPGRSRSYPPTPAEVAAVRQFALRYPQTGYKRLAWRMMDEQVAALLPYQVLAILHELDLVTRRPAPSPLAARPAPATRPDEVWHIDLMYLRVGGAWYYLVDVLDSYSRYLVHYRLNPTMTTASVLEVVQEAIELLPADPPRRPGEPQIVHDHGSQFVSRDWRTWIQGVGATDIRTRVAHPQSNGRVERVHRTHREEGLAGLGDQDYAGAVTLLDEWVAYYNWRRAHSALQHLPPGVYYRGDPEAELARRAAYLQRARTQREQYWQRQEEASEPAP
jgi:putative transposase